MEDYIIVNKCVYENELYVHIEICNIGYKLYKKSKTFELIGSVYLDIDIYNIFSHIIYKNDTYYLFDYDINAFSEIFLCKEFNVFGFNNIFYSYNGVLYYKEKTPFELSIARYPCEKKDDIYIAPNNMTIKTIPRYLNKYVKYFVYKNKIILLDKKCKII